MPLGIPTPFHDDIFGVNFVSEEPCFRSLLLETVLLRLPRNAEWNFLLQRLPDARALTFRRLTHRDSACLAMLANHTFAGMVGGIPYSFTPFLRRVAKKAGIRVTAPLATSHPKDWCVTFADSPFIPRIERIPSFKIDPTSGQASGALLCNAEVTLFSCFYSAQLTIKKAIEMSIAFRLPTSERITFTEVASRPSSKSVSEMVAIGGDLLKGAYSKNNPSLSHLAATLKTSESIIGPLTNLPQPETGYGSGNFRV